MIVSRTVYSNGGHSIRNFVVLRMQFLSLRTKSEEGPVPEGSRLGLRLPMMRPLEPRLAFVAWARACSAAASACSRARLACSAAANLE